MMVPTEILAEQHYQTAKNWFDPLDIQTTLLTSGLRDVEKNKIKGKLENGEIPFVVGTHALIQEGVSFQRLGFVIIDEQHRFGVLQRQAIHQKGPSPDILVMTATPIPRTLAMTVYGDLEVSIINELPKGKKPITTRLYGENQRKLLYQGMNQELVQGHQIYVVYPLIEESEKVDLKNATEMSKELKRVFEPKYPVALLHGKLSSEEKTKIMHDFREGRVTILATTSVIEVGVDVPNATVMVIEHAERFGLSQLHQLRGRVGRSTKLSYCILMADYKRSDEAKRRLSIMVESNDGFRIAEEDLSIRGPGEFLGTKQSGISEFRIANIVRDIEILQQARKAAFDLITEDPFLKKPDNLPFKQILESRWGDKLDLIRVS